MVIDTKLNNEKISKDFNNLQKDTEKLIDNYNRSVDSIKSQELAIDKVKGKLENLQLYAKSGLLKEGEDIQIVQLTSKLELMNSKLEETKNKANKLKNAVIESLNKKNTLSFGNGINDIGKKIDKFKNKMSRLIGTAMIFSLMRNQLTNLRNGFISLLKQNSDFSNSLGKIKANLMTAFAPIYNACLPAINSLMNSLAKLAGTIAMFTSGLFGTSIDDARKSAKGLSKDLNKVGSSAKNASGNLASFDNLEVIGSSNSSGGVNNSVNYDTEISYNQKLLDILNAVKDFIVENKELILGFLSGIAFGILAIKLGVEGIEGLAFGTILAGIVILIQSIVEFIQDPSWDNFAKILQGLAILLTGVAIAMLAVNAANPVAWIILAIAAVVTLAAVIIKNWDDIKNVLGSVGAWIYNHVIKPVADFFSGLWQGIKNGVNDSVQWVKDKFWSIIDFFNNLISKIVGFFKSLGTKVGNAIGSAFIMVVNGVLGAVENILNFPIKSINKLINTINKVPGIKLGTLPTFKLPRLASGTVIPPRHEFAAILGDQKHGTNIEAPLETIKQANREVMQEFLGTLANLNDQEREIVLKNMTFVLQFGSSNFQKIVIDSIRLSEKELGKQLLLA